MTGLAWLGATGAALLVYAVWVVRRNRGLQRPPVVDARGEPLPARRLQLSDGECVAFHDAGTGPAVLLVPGADGIKETFRYQVPALMQDHRVICADLRTRLAPADTLDRFADDLAELLDHLEIPEAAVVGQSLGGAIAMRFAVRHPGRVRALVLSNTLARVSYEHVGLNRAALTPVAMATTRWLPTPVARALARLWSRVAVWIFDDSPGGARVVEYALFTGARTVSPRVSSVRVDRLRRTDLRPEVPAIQAPTLVLKGPRDCYTPPAWAEEIARLIPGSSYVTIPGTGHCSHISMPGSFNRILIDWLAGTARPAKTPGEEVVE